MGPVLLLRCYEARFLSHAWISPLLHHHCRVSEAHFGPDCSGARSPRRAGANRTGSDFDSRGTAGAFSTGRSARSCSVIPVQLRSRIQRFG